MRHLIVCREYPPSYAPGGIGTYAVTIARLLAEAGEEVHVIGPRWAGAPDPIERFVDGRLIVHRVYGEPPEEHDDGPADVVGRALAGSLAPRQAFSWRAALLAESLVEQEEIDVVEAEDWEAGLYFFQLRRALGLGPTRQPPCLIHLHSPTELIYQINEYLTADPAYRLTVQLEDYCIGAADAWVCPSRHLARRAEARYGLPAGAVTTIPLPAGSTPRLTRDADVWARGPICFVGRLQPNKGVIEWVEAAVGAARRDPTLAFDFVGSNTQLADGGSMQAYLESRIPAALRPAFRFHGWQPRDAVVGFLARARAAVVPSHWENFPNTCVEAMASGLPVIVSPNGGMLELVEDGRTGWIAPSSSPAGLAVALDRMLRLAPEELEAAGRAAADAVRTVCDNDQIVERHLALHRAVAERGASRSRQLPPSYPWTRGAPSPRPPAATTTLPPRAGTVVVLALDDDRELLGRPDAGAVVAATIASVDAQEHPPADRVLTDRVLADRVLVFDAPNVAYAGVADAVDAARASGWRLVQTASGQAGPAGGQTAHGVDAPLGVLVVAPGARLAPDFLVRCESVLAAHPEVGVVTTWVDAAPRWQVPPCPTLPFQLLINDSGPATLFRADALAAAGGLRGEIASAYQSWDATNAVLGAGWAAVTFPAPLVTLDREAAEASAHTRGLPLRARRQLLDRVPNVLGAGAADLITHLEDVAERARLDLVAERARLERAEP